MGSGRGTRVKSKYFSHGRYTMVEARLTSLLGNYEVFCYLVNGIMEYALTALKQINDDR